MATTLRSAKRFLEKVGLRPAQRGPASRYRQVADDGAGLVPVPAAPYYLQEDVLGDPPPDRGLTPEWPVEG